MKFFIGIINFKVNIISSQIISNFIHFPLINAENVIVNLFNYSDSKFKINAAIIIQLINFFKVINVTIVAIVIIRAFHAILNSNFIPIKFYSTISSF